MHVIDHFDAERIRALSHSGEFFWLDLEAPTAAQIDELAELFDLPPLAVEDSREFNQRAKIDDYDDRLLIVFYGATPTLTATPLVELHMHITPGRGAPPHPGPAPPGRVGRARAERCRAHEPVKSTHVPSDREIVYRILGALSESVLALVR